jgi:cobalt-zinc-cadmium efflux system membrane fusion protein
MTKTQIALGALAIALVAGAGGYVLNDRLNAPATTGDQTDEHGHGEGEADGVEAAATTAEGEVLATAQQMAAAGITLVAVTSAPGGGVVQAAGTLVPAANATGDVTARTTGVVTRILRQVGDSVRVGDGLAIIDSREVAEAQAGLARASRAAELARATFAREENLYRQKVIARADYDQAKAAYDAARIEVDLAQETLKALGAQARGGNIRLLTLTSPIAGEVTAVSVSPGEFVSAERELFKVSNQAQMWADLRIPARDVERVRRGQRVTVSVQGSDHSHPGTIRFLSPAVDAGSGAVRAIAVVQNPDAELRVGQAVTAHIEGASDGTMLPAVPRAALQEVEGRTVVFVRTPRGFVARPVVAGDGSEAAVPIRSGLKRGEQVAATNSFVLKAELGKSEAEHAH